LHKNTNQTVDYMVLGFMIFMRGLDITWGIGRVLLKVSPVLGPDFRAQNRLNFQQNPSNAPGNVNAPHKNHKAPRHIINSLINSYKRTVQRKLTGVKIDPNYWYCSAGILFLN